MNEHAIIIATHQDSLRGNCLRELAEETKVALKWQQVCLRFSGLFSLCSTVSQWPFMVYFIREQQDTLPWRANGFLLCDN